MTRLKLKKKKFLLFIAIAFFFALFVWLGIGRLTNKSTSHNIDLRTASIQNLIILDNIAFIDVNSPASAEQHKTIKEKLAKNIEEIERLRVQLDDEKQKNELKQMLDSERTTLKAYASQIDALYKVLSYNPADDLESVDQNQLKTRAGAAEKGIAAVLDRSIGSNEIGLGTTKIKLGDGSREALEKSKTCFARLAEGSLTTSKECIETHTKTRKTLNIELQNLWATDEIKTVKATLQKLARRVN